jgi:hypothetical protein
MKRGVKSQAVREYLAENPQASPKAIVDGLKAKGIKVKVTLVNSIKYKKPSKPGRRRKSARRVAAQRNSSAGVTIEQLIEVKRLADSLGGVDQIRSALDMLQQLQ